MGNWLITFHTTLISGATLAAALVFALWEWCLPRHPWTQPPAQRIVVNIALRVLNGVVVAFLLPIASIAFAVQCKNEGAGALNWIVLPAGAAGVLSVLALSLSAYGLHRVLHVVPMLWKIHRAHHSDLDLDFSTSVRHHPFEVVLAWVAQLATIAVLGIAPAALVIYTVLEVANAVFTHANVRLPAKVERLLGCVLVTPAMHRVHHSSDAAAANRNFSTLLPWWDKLFGTYAERAASNEVGLAQLRAPRDVTLARLLLLPFAK